MKTHQIKKLTTYTFTSDVIHAYNTDNGTEIMLTEEDAIKLRDDLIAALVDTNK